MLPNTHISACRFHLGQAIQEYGLSPLYKNKDTEESKWLTKCFGLSFLEPVDAGYAFVEDIMNDEMPENSDCERFANYLTNNYIDTTASFPLSCGRLHQMMTSFAPTMPLNRSMRIWTDNFTLIIRQYLFSLTSWKNYRQQPTLRPEHCYDQATQTQAQQTMLKSSTKSTEMGTLRELLLSPQRDTNLKL